MPPSRSIVAASIIAAALALAASAQAGPSQAPTGIAAAFGNTVKALYADGRAQRIWLEADGHWEAVGRNGKKNGGNWTAKGEKVCLKQTKPVPIPFSYCTAFPSDGGPGVAWASKDMNGEPIRLVLVKGIER